MDLIELIKEEINSLRESLNESFEVFHGSDRKFDDFDLNKIGSGDGKSLGGWGIYFSDDINVSKRYYIKSGFIGEYELEDGKYFDLDMLNTDGYNILKQLKRKGVDESEIEEFENEYANSDEITNKQIYDWLSYVLGSEKEASLLLKSIGYVGNTFIDKWETNARNYVVYNLGVIRKKEDFDEGVADKYAEREFDIPNKMVNKNTDYFSSSTKGNLVGQIEMRDIEDNSNVYLNPPNLNGFERDVRAISDINGNLYVADVDGGFNHSDLAYAVDELKDIDNIYEDINETKIILWIRRGETNSFRLSISSTDYIYYPKNKPLIKTLFDNVKRKNPQFEFDF